MSFRYGHVAPWFSTFMRRPYIALKWTWWLRASLRAMTPWFSVFIVSQVLISM